MIRSFCVIGEFLGPWITEFLRNNLFLSRVCNVEQCTFSFGYTWEIECPSRDVCIHFSNRTCKNNLDSCRHVYGRFFSSFVPKTCL